jgi:hypothetical protein
MTFARGRKSAARRRAWWLVIVAGIAVLPAPAADPPRQDAKPEADGNSEADAGDLDRKAQVLASDRWRRAMFEFNAWLDAQPVYSPTQVAAIRRELTSRVTTMSSFEVEYLLETMSAKLQVLETPAARDARGWLGRYLEVMSDAKRAEVLRDVPNVLDMSAAELEAAVQRIETKRAEVARRHDEVLAAQQDFAGFQRRVGRDDAAARAGLAAGRDAAPPFSPYRGPAARSAPFAGAYESPTVVGASPWGSFLAVPIEAF